MAKGKRYEGSPADKREDRAGARATGVTQKQYERTARDKAEDKRGQAKIAKRKR